MSNVKIQISSQAQSLKFQIMALSNSSQVMVKDSQAVVKQLSRRVKHLLTMFDGLRSKPLDAKHLTMFDSLNWAFELWNLKFKSEGV